MKSAKEIIFLCQKKDQFDKIRKIIKRREGTYLFGKCSYVYAQYTSRIFLTIKIETKFFGIFYLLAPVWIYKQTFSFLAYPEDTIPGDGWGGVMGVV